MLSLRVLKSDAWNHNRNTPEMFFQYYLFNFLSTLYSTRVIVKSVKLKKKKISPRICLDLGWHIILGVWDKNTIKIKILEQKILASKRSETNTTSSEPWNKIWQMKDN